MRTPDGRRPDRAGSCLTDGLLDRFTVEEGDVFIYSDGTAYLQAKGGCSFIATYFEPGFEARYSTVDGKRFIDSGLVHFPTSNVLRDPFERYAAFLDLFARNNEHADRFWTEFTAQSPATPTVPDYVALRNRVFDGSGDFIDHRVELAADPDAPGNAVVKLTAVAPTADMGPSKASLGSTLCYFVEGTDLWFEARYFIASGHPFSLADFESSYLLESPGPRLVVRGDELGFENKFADRQDFRPTISMPVPRAQWFTVKAHVSFSSSNDGRYELWVNGVQTLDTPARTLPLSISIQNIIEVGLTSTHEATAMYVDDVRLSDVAF